MDKNPPPHHPDVVLTCKRHIKPSDFYCQNGSSLLSNDKEHKTNNLINHGQKTHTDNIILEKSIELNQNLNQQQIILNSNNNNNYDVKLNESFCNNPESRFEPPLQKKCKRQDISKSSSDKDKLTDSETSDTFEQEKHMRGRFYSADQQSSYNQSTLLNDNGHSTSSSYSDEFEKDSFLSDCSGNPEQLNLDISFIPHQDKNSWSHQSDSHSECFSWDQEDNQKLEDLNNAAQSMLQIHGAIKQSQKKISSLKQVFACRCFKRHIFETTIERLKKDDWCPQCAELIKPCQAYAQTQKGQLLSQKLSSELLFMCSKQHQFSLQYSSYQNNWCQQCKKEEREEIHRYIKEQQAKFSQIQEENQKRMFEEARRQYSSQSNSSSSTSQKHNIKSEKKEKYTQKVIEAFKRVEKQVEEEAIKQHSQEGSISQGSLEVIKILMIPDPIFQTYFETITLEMLKQEYKRLARLVHPDKNSHAKAHKAFQKVNNYYILAKNKHDQ